MASYINFIIIALLSFIFSVIGENVYENFDNLNIVEWVYPDEGKITGHKKYREFKVR